MLSEIRLHREGLASRLAGQPWIELVGSAGTMSEAVRLAIDQHVDVVLLDLPPTRDNLIALGRASAAASAVRFIVLGAVRLEDDVIAWVEAGAAAMVEPGGCIGELRAVLECAMVGELRCSPRIAGALLRRVRALAPDPQAQAESENPLTPRETEILELVAEGLTNKEIARRLSIRLATVKNHVHNILEKLSVHSRAAAIAALPPRPRRGGP